MTLQRGILGNAIRNARISQNISQEQLAEDIGITPTHLKHIESEHRNPSIDILFKLSTKLNISLDNLLFPPNFQHIQQIQEIHNLLNQSTTQELQIIQEIICSLHKNRLK